jgi:hypothetical protein
MSEHPRKIGSVKVIDMATGEVESEKKNTFTLLPCAPDKCQECAVDHPYDQPHNKQSLYYQYRFYGTHGRWPTWTDAMAHCTPEVKATWCAGLIEQHRLHNLSIPDDLLSEGTGR